MCPRKTLYRFSRPALAVLAAVALLVLDGWRTDAAAQGPPGAVRIGLVGTLFQEVPPALVTAAMRPFRALMESQTGLQGDLLPVNDADALAGQLDHGQLDLGVFHGLEFAWARQKHHELQPLMIAVNQNRHLRAHLVVRHDGPAGLRDQPVALPRGSREHCRLFLERQCRACGLEPELFFHHVTRPDNAEDALDDVVDGLVPAAVVDGVALDCYQHRKPGRFARLRVAATSEPFPAAAVVYRPGALDDGTLARFRNGLLNAHRNAQARQMLTLFKITGFEAVPVDYEQTLADIVKAYPPPGTWLREPLTRKDQAR